MWFRAGRRHDAGVRFRRILSRRRPFSRNVQRKTYRLRRGRYRAIDKTSLAFLSL